MEDAHTVVLDLDKGVECSNTFFAVYDGHGGGTVARFAGQNVHKRLISEESYHQHQFAVALKRAFLGTDEDLLADPSHNLDPSGCTAVVVLVTSDNKVYVANAGDSRTVMGIKGRVKSLSFDHKPANEEEKVRIQGAGGFVEYGRVNGNLALSRALGDFEFKKNYSLSPEKQIITANPDVTCHELSEEDEFLVLACDGIWDCLNSQQVVDIVRGQVAEGKELWEVCEMICDLCLAPDTSSGSGLGCDNMTIMIVAILNGRTKEQWYAWIKQRVADNYGYPTPTSLPTLYSSYQLMTFRSRVEARERSRQVPSEVRPLNSGGVTVLDCGGVTNDHSSLLMFRDDDGDEVDGEIEEGNSFFIESLGLGQSEVSEPTQQLRQQLEEFENEERDKDSQEAWLDDGEEDRLHENPDHEFPRTDATSQEFPHSKPLPNGDFTLDITTQLSLSPSKEPDIREDTKEL